MALPRSNYYVFYQGLKFQVEFYFTPQGRLPAKEYFDSLDQVVQVKLLALVKYIAEHGKLYDQRKFRIVDSFNKIYEFKPKDERFFNFFFEGRRIIITNAYRKHGQKLDLKELQKAIKAKVDFEFRYSLGVYYETQ